MRWETQLLRMIAVMRFICFLPLTALLLTVPAVASAQMRPMTYAETTVPVTPSEAFSDWTSSDAVQDFFAPQATIDPVAGGLYELCFDLDADAGSCGNDDGRILAIQEDEMLSFTWAMPPYMPDIRPHLTTVQIWFVPVGDDKTRVRLFHTGYGSGDQWDEGRAYFDRVWPLVLENYRDSKTNPEP